MIRGIYTAATGMLAQERKQDVVSNNLANSTTHGFKKDKVILHDFREMLIYRVEKDRLSAPLGSMSLGAMVDEVVTIHLPGDLEQTGRSLDVALAMYPGAENEAFFTLDNGDGDLYYGRNGHFQLDADGFLVDGNGYYVQGEEGPIFLESDKVSIGEGGEIYANGEYIDTIQVGFFNPAEIEKIGDNLFQPEEGAAAVGAENFTIRQGFLEQANINMVREMVDMITVLRTYEANQKSVQAHDEILGKAVNELGSLR